MTSFGGLGRPKWRKEFLWGQPFYVDERDGILKRTDRLPEEKARRRRLCEARKAVAAARDR